MDIIKKISSRGFFVFNFVFIGIIIGVSLAFFSFSFTVPKPDNIARAQASFPDIHIPQEALFASVEIQGVINAIAEKTLSSVVEVKTITAQRSQNQVVGSGLIVRYEDEIYYVITNNHVIDRATSIFVATRDGTEYNAILTGRDVRRDLAVLSFQTDEHFPLADLGDSDTVRIGDWAMAMGNPMGEQFAFSVTMGVVSALGRTGGPGGNINDFIQTDAAIVQGNSGGPLVNLRGEVIGINTWIASNIGGGFIGLGFAIPINNIIRVIDDIISSGSANDGWLGVSLFDPTRDMIESMSLAGIRGALVAHMSLGSPADISGIRVGDFITHVDNIEMRGSNHLVQTLGSIRPGDRAVFRVLRDGVSIDFTADILARSSVPVSNNRNLWPGLMVAVLNESLRSYRNLPSDARGLFVTQVISGSPASVTGLQYGDRITAVNDIPVQDQASFYRVLRENTESELWFSFIRGSNPQESFRYRR